MLAVLSSTGAALGGLPGDSDRIGFDDDGGVDVGAFVVPAGLATAPTLPRRCTPGDSRLFALVLGVVLAEPWLPEDDSDALT